MMLATIVLASFVTATPTPDRPIVRVDNVGQLRRALADARPGTIIRIAPGTYPGGTSISGLRGTADLPITIEAEGPSNPPVFQGGGSALHLQDVAHLELRNLVVVKATGNGINIDDGGTLDTPSHHLRITGLVVRDIGPDGNHDGLKLSGVDDFRVENCTFERWGRGGSAIDMVGCHRGSIAGSVFRFEDDLAATGVQAKGGSSELVVKDCRFEHAGGRAINIGGSTDLAYFRPQDAPYEAKAITVEDCVFIGSMAPFAFVGVDGAIVRRNTIHRPARWCFRILQETRAERFVPCRDGRLIDNLIVFRGDEVRDVVNVGPDTAPETFTLSGNAWYRLDAPRRGPTALPVVETGALHGERPEFEDAETGDLRLKNAEGPLRNKGAAPGSTSLQPR